MHDIAFADAARPTPVVILKLPLRSYSIGHELRLLKRRNALLLLSHEQFNALDFSAQVQSLIEAVLICADTWQERELLESPNLFGWRVRWHNLKVRAWLRRLRREDYPLAIAEVRNYLAAGRELPPVPDEESAKMCAEMYGYDSDSTGREFGAPLIVNLCHFICEHAAAIPQYESPYDAPYSLVAWLYFAQHESAGSYRIQNRKEYETQERMAQLRREVAEERAKEQPSNIVTIPAPSTGLATVPPDLSDPPETEAPDA